MFSCLDICCWHWFSESWLSYNLFSVHALEELDCVLVFLQVPIFEPFVGIFIINSTSFKYCPCKYFFFPVVKYYCCCSLLLLLVGLAAAFVLMTTLSGWMHYCNSSSQVWNGVVHCWSCWMLPSVFLMYLGRNSFAISNKPDNGLLFVTGFFSTVGFFF